MSGLFKVKIDLCLAMNVYQLHSDIAAALHVLTLD